MNKRFLPSATAVVIAPAMLLVLVVAHPAAAGTKYQTSLVPNVAGTTPGFSQNGSSIKLDDRVRVKGKIKKVVDAAGALVTTDGVPSADDYTVEIDISVPATAGSGTVTVPFDVKNGNGKFDEDLTADPAFAGATSGDGVAVTAVRVKDGTGTVLGVGGFAVK
jgi:hypothetical protein